MGQFGPRFWSQSRIDETHHLLELHFSHQIMSIQPTESIIREFAPKGILRASLNLGNPVLASSKTSSETPAGVTIDLSRALAAELGVEVVFMCFPTAAESVTKVTTEEADIGFMAIDPKRAQGIHFTAAYVQIEGSYAVPNASPITSNQQVDVTGIDIVVGDGSAYDLFLTRELKLARIFRVPFSDQVIVEMLQHNHPVAAGVRQQLEAEVNRTPGARVLPGSFMVINQASAMPRGRSIVAHAYLDDFIERMKKTGFVLDALKRHGIEGAKVAPPA